jgi:ABC-type lipoprotein release transport system permease subunit
VRVGTIDRLLGAPYDRAMRAVGYLVRTQVRALAGPTVLLSIVVAVVFALVITFATGARRTETVPARVERAVGGDFDFLVTQQQMGRPILTDDVAALRGVELADSFTFVFGGVTADDPSGMVDALLFAGSEQAFGATVVDGRHLDQRVDDEFVATRSFVDATGAEVGDRFDLFTLTQEQIAEEGFERSTPDPERTLTASLVGVIDGPSMIEDPTPFVLFPRRLLDRQQIGVAVTMINVKVDSATDESALRRELAGLPGGPQLSVEPAELISGDMQRAIRTQARGMWVLAVVAAVAAVVALAQLLTRQTRLSLSERHGLSAVGFSAGQMVLQSLARATPPIVLGGLLGTALAVPFSTLFPTGKVGEFEPDSGVLVQWSVLIVAAMLLIGSLFACTAVVLAITPNRVSETRPSPVVDALASRSPMLPVAVGMRLGFTSARSERGSKRAALAGIFLTVSGLVAALTFGVSLGRLIDEPFRYGRNVDVVFGDDGGERIDPELAARLESDPDVESLNYYAQGFVQTGRSDVPIMGLQRVRGSSSPVMLVGRPPVSEDEVAFGQVTAREVGVGVGDEVTLSGSAGEHTFRVVGLAVLVGFGSNEGIGEGALTTLDGFEQISDASITSATADFRSSMEEAADRYGDLTATTTEQFVPGAISSLLRVRAIPFVLAGLLAVLVVLTISHTLLTTLRARRRDLAVFRALGAAPRFVSSVVHWQATLVTLVPALVGVPLGLVVGRLLFVALADEIGAVDTAALPLRSIVAVLVAVLVFANVVAIWPARIARRWAPAKALNAE